MLSKDKIILMTAVSVYEDGEGKEDLAINGYFRGDYMGFEVLKGAIYGTIAFALIFAMYMLYDLETFMVEFYKMDIMAFAQDVLKRYLIFLAIYVVISFFVALYKHNRAKKHIENYKAALKTLYNEF
ncbi:MAG: hypothetical protein Q4D29_04645 [Lachnospiraceae bacterium]|nr:hypothetical protein [Lachnospiraceae bacterium]